MAQTGQSKTVRMPNGNRVTVTTGYNAGGYYRKVTVRRPDGTSESRTDRKGVGLLNTGLFDISGPYSQGVPQWAGGKDELGTWGSMIVLGLGVIAAFLFFGWPWLLHTTKPTKIAVACVWYAFLLGGVTLLVVYVRRRRSLSLDDIPADPTQVPAVRDPRLSPSQATAPPVQVTVPPTVDPPQVLRTESIWPQRFTDKWFRETGPFLSAAHALALGKELRMRGWSDKDITERAAPHVPFRVI